MKIVRKIKSLASKSYKKFKKITTNDKNIYLVYTMGKVGSSTIYKTLKKEMPYSDIFHVHFLSESWLDYLLPKEDKLFHNNIKIGKDILEFIEKHPNRKIKIITLVREPIIRSISDLFQNWKHIYDDIENIDNDKLQKHLKEINHEYTLNWFDTEFKEYLNIDIYNQPFDKNNGYEIYTFKNLDILCIKLEELNNKGTIALAQFIGKNIPLASANKSTDKKGKEQYNYLKKHIKFPENKLLEIYNSKYMTHFYSEKEKNKFIKKWKL